MRVLRLITGLTFTRFGINEQREPPTKHTNQHEKFRRYKTRNLSYFSRVSWAPSRSRIGLGSHVGSFEVLRALGVMQRGFPLKVLMDTVHNQNISRFFDALNPKIAGTVIAPDRPDTLIRVKESLDNGYFVGMLGDRVFGGDKTTQCQFLGAPATFPAGPILLAAMMRCPVILFFGLYRGGNRYEIYFEHFADVIVLERDRRAEETQLWMQRYAERLEHYARLAPYNWFNFYPFWDQ